MFFPRPAFRAFSFSSKKLCVCVCVFCKKRKLLSFADQRRTGTVSQINSILNQNFSLVLFTGCFSVFCILVVVLRYVRIFQRYIFTNTVASFDFVHLCVYLFFLSSKRFSPLFRSFFVVFVTELIVVVYFFIIFID